MRKIFLFLLAAFISYQSNAQGCVAIRSNGNACTMMNQHDELAHNSNNWIIGFNSRYFKSYKHFVGTEEQKQRVDEGTEVINHFFSTEVAVTRQINSRWAFAFYVPVIANTRSSMYEHYGNASSNPNARRETHSFGVGDIRMAGYYWLIEPAKAKKGNVQVGLGVKLPTGDYRYQDYFYKNDSVKVLGPVDQSIQLGDGGTGITTEVNAFYHVTKSFSVYANAFYLLNPREQNGVSTARGGTTSASAITYGSDVMSVPDQYMLRAGGSVAANNFLFSGGVRMECVPSEDLIGGSIGFRRPGYVVSVEPVVSYKVNKTQFYFSVPFAVQRNRTQSYPDKLRTEKTGVYTHGDAAFADYTINFGVSFLLK
ncbi:MAG: hypothetical protein ACJ749_03050 [Flavisolibacter sp.]